ncbi:hypothetical protein DEU56DRAFT_906859 [Suillus clintonianus]|uniref:uncharacterized protein n=1 Tax=Suillus clintonianus TaxID=1904413 RepID=UPI001B865C46|nr:uncharacterized protein DEU56DRAFT_906859 [Suillus clintonianus]KAG2155683.1 hypothetical protein DEU56DRAFT_906859 [Suillus clintonianus]
MISAVSTTAQDLSSFSYVQIAVAVAVLYDHALTFGREIDYIWRRPPSLVAALYLLDRYLGDSVVILGVYLCLTEVASTQSYLLLMMIVFCVFFQMLSTFPGPSLGYPSVFMAHSVEVLAVVVIIWRTIGPTSKLVVTDEPYPGKHLCSFSGINTNFTYLFIPVLCFEILLFFLAIKVSLNNMRDRRATPGTSSLRVNSFMSILVRDSILYFFINLAMCAIVMGLWRNAAALHANISIPFIMLVETVIGTRMVINFKEHCSRRMSSEPIMVTGSIRFAGVNTSEDTARLDSIHAQSMKDDETRPIKDDEESAVESPKESTEIIAFEEI